METPAITRRRSIAIGATALTATLGGLALGTDTAGAQADVELGTLETADDATLAPEDGEAYAPWLIIEGEWTYRVEADPDEWETYLLIGDGSGNTSAVGMASGPADALEASGTYVLRGPVTAADAWAPSDFSVGADGSPTTVEVPIQVVFVVRDADQSMLVQATVEDAVEITVEQGGTTANLSGQISVRLQDDAGDPTPELPEA